MNLPDRPDTSGLPSIELTGNGAFRMGYSLQVNQCNCPLDQREFVFQVVNNWTKIRGNHTFKWGTDIRRAQNRRLPSDRKRNGNFTFAPTVTGSADVSGSGIGAATFLLGAPSMFERFVLNAIDMEDMQWRMFYFAQDTWRITPKLTMSLGLRWDTWFPNQSINEGQGSRYDVVTNSVIIAGVGGNSKSANVKDSMAELLTPPCVCLPAKSQDSNSNRMGAFLFPGDLRQHVQQYGEQLPHANHANRAAAEPLHARVYAKPGSADTGCS